MLNELNISNSNLNFTALVIESGLLYGKGKHENASKCFLLYSTESDDDTQVSLMSKWELEL